MLKRLVWLAGPVIIPGSIHSDVGHYKWYQSLESSGSVADRDVRPLRGVIMTVRIP